MTDAADYGLVDIQITVPDLEVESAVWVSTNPCLIVYRRSLAAKV
jgi:hypothetical protein